MPPLALGEAVLGGALLFFLPGFTIAKALFPERRWRGPDGVRWLLELFALGLVLSVVLTVLVGYLLLTVAPGGFAAAWIDPLLEAALAAISLVAFGVGWLNGAYRREPPPRRSPAEAPEGADPWALNARLERLQRDRLALDRALAATPEGGAPDLRARRATVVAEEGRLRRAREAEYDR